MFGDREDGIPDQRAVSKDPKVLVGRQAANRAAREASSSASEGMASVPFRRVMASRRVAPSRSSRAMPFANASLALILNSRTVNWSMEVSVIYSRQYRYACIIYFIYADIE